jgi:GrpB-like predicted nucleotidyltransferase (UPF0157 family)
VAHRPTSGGLGAAVNLADVGGEDRVGMEPLEQPIARVVAEPVELAPYDPRWPAMFRQEREHLVASLPAETIRRIEHFGSTAIPGMTARPVIDILVEVGDLEEAKLLIVPVLESQGYDYFWRPTCGDDGPPFYAWLIKRDPASALTTSTWWKATSRRSGTGCSFATT